MNYSDIMFTHFRMALVVCPGRVMMEGTLEGLWAQRSVNTENFILLFKSTKQYSDPDYILCRKYMYTCAML